MNKIIRPHRFHKFIYFFLILFGLIALYYYMCCLLGLIPYFITLLERLAFSLGGRALSLALCKSLGCSGGLALAIGFSARALFASGAPADLLHFMNEDGAEASSPSWTAVLGSSHSDPETANPSVNQPLAGPVPPANPGEAAGQPDEDIPPVIPYPYQPDQVIGGDSVNSIQLRLLANEPFPSAEKCRQTRLEAEDLFEVKVDIIQIMSVLDPTGDWMEQGAEALYNPRSTSGEHKLESLYGILERLRLRGNQSEDFFSLRDKMIFRRDIDLHDENSINQID